MTCSAPTTRCLRRWLPSDLTRGPVAAFAAHAGVGPTVPGGALFAFWQAAYHLFGQWHGRGGAQNLTDALVTRLRSLGGASALLGTGGADRGARRACARGGARRAASGSQRVDRDHRHRPEDAPCSTCSTPRSVVRPAPTSPPPAAPTSSRPSSTSPPTGCPPTRQPARRLERVAELRRPPRRPHPRLEPVRGRAASRPAPAVRLHALRHRRHARPTRPAHRLPGLPGRAVDDRRRLGRRSDEFVERCLDTVEAGRPGFRATHPRRRHLDARRDGARRTLARRPPDAPRHRPRPARPVPADQGLGGWRTPIAGLYISGAGTNPPAASPGPPAARPPEPCSPTSDDDPAGRDQRLSMRWRWASVRNPLRLASSPNCERTPTTESASGTRSMDGSEISGMTQPERDVRSVNRLG